MTTPMTTTSTIPSHEEITRRAFNIWCEHGRRPGTAESDWRAAELELAREREHGALSDSHDAQDAKDEADAGRGSSKD
jgi:hypothetical protein